MNTVYILKNDLGQVLAERLNKYFNQHLKTELVSAMTVLEDIRPNEIVVNCTISDDSKPRLEVQFETYIRSVNLIDSKGTKCQNCKSIDKMLMIAEKAIYQHSDHFIFKGQK